jgi:protein phosphatase inhibitor 2
MGKMRATNAVAGDEIETEEEMDEEAAAKHAAFVRARGRHYSNEAEAMKKAAMLMDEEEDGDNGGGDVSNGPAVPDVPHRGSLVNGDTHGE